MQNKIRVLVINPGSTSTKLAVFDNEKQIFSKNIQHSTENLSPYPDISSQYPFREKVILETLDEAKILLETIDAVVGRGGLLYPLEGGTYEVDEIMLEHLKTGVQGQHASNLGGVLAYAIAAEIGNIPAFIVDPVVVDEMKPVAKLSGHPLITRRSIFHALNQKAVARKAAHQLGKKYNDVNLIVAHIGGGISIGAHEKGKVIDVNNALNGDGPFAPERSGGLPAADLVKLCFSGKYQLKEVLDMLRGKGGMVAYLGINDVRDVKKKIVEGDQKAKLVFEAMAYQIAKEIGLLATVLEGDIDAIALSGGVAYATDFVDLIRKRVEWIAPIIVFPGEEEMEALAQGALRVLKREEKAKIYAPKK
ncbi:butyrate kinase [bacterium]|nr:butyrate kinase [bacterium]